MLHNIKHRIKKYCVLFAGALIIILYFSSCKKYLDEKSDKQLVVPTTLNDAQALLDFYSTMNANMPALGSESDDDFYLLTSYFNTLALARKTHHTWTQDALNETDWMYLYQIVLQANLALETVAKQPAALQLSAQASNIRGAAYFFRSLGFYHAAQIYTQPYNAGTAGNLPGIALRLNSDAGIVSTRATLEASWQQMINDLKLAISLLPTTSSNIARPTKIAAYGQLANVYLDMANYTGAYKYADSALQLKNTLVNFNTLNVNDAFPFVRTNNEVIFSAVTQLYGVHTLTNYRVDSTLYLSYATNDLRRTLYFKSNGTGTFGFRGSYDGTASPFNGIATDELYLMKAECAARNNRTDTAMLYLNKLLVTRWVTGTYVNMTAGNATQALQMILKERRKELILRERRWKDLRRLNQEPAFAKTLIRVQNGITYMLPPNDSRYTYLIPANVIALTGMQQNVR